MFATTFLGHQGWLFRSDRSAILVDPLLCEDFGQIHALEYRVFPPRKLDLAKLPALDAVVLSHEHDDHFDIPSLAKLPRTVPIYLSARSSTAAHAILGEMGFAVRPLVPGVPVALGDLEIVPFAGNHQAVDCGDEWDTLPYLVRHADGSFFTLVDITLTEGHIAWAKAHAKKPGIVAWTNNALDWSHMAHYLAERVEGTQQCFVKMGVGHKLIAQQWGTPVAMVMCAGGFSFTGERAWLNDRVFCVDTEAVCAAMTKVYKTEKFISGIPGQTFVMVSGRLQRVDRTSDFLEAAPRAEWPSRAKAGRTDVPDYAPATGRRTLDASERERLGKRLDEFAGVMVGGSVFRAVCSVLDGEAPGKVATFAFVLRDGVQRRTFEYDLPACAFRERPPGIDHVSGFECWASDLLAVLDGELGPIALMYARARLWNAVSTRLSFDVFADLYRHSHPLRRPAEVLAVYRRLWASTGT